MLVDFEYLYKHLGKLLPGPFSFFYFFNYSLRNYEGHIHFTQKLDYLHLFAKILTSQKGWNDTFLKIRKGLDKKRACWLTMRGKLAFLIKWKAIEKWNMKKGLDELCIEDKTMVNVTTDVT